MASYTSSSSLTGQINIGTATSINISGTSASEYPSGTVSFSGLSQWYLTGGASPGVYYYFNVYLCDSSGNNRSKICSVTIQGNSNYHAGVSSPTSGSISANSGLSNKPLYIIAECTGISYNDTAEYRALATSRFQLRASGSGCYVTINTSNAQGGSSFTVDDVEFGSVSTVQISNPYISSLWHRVTWAIDSSHTHTEDTSTGQTSISYTIPNTSSWLSTASNDVRATMTVTVVTYSGQTQVGSDYTTINAIVPATVVPSIGSISASVYNPKSGFSGVYIQGLTGANITMSNVNAGSGASISSYSCVVSSGETATRNGNVFTVSTLNHSGTIEFSVSVTDTRGRVSSVQKVSIPVVAYSAPTITAAVAYRCKSTGVASETGTYAAIRASVSYTPLTGNSYTLNSKYYLSTDPDTKYTAQNNMSTDTQYIIGGGNLDVSYTYYVEFTVTDTMGGTSTLTVQIQTSAYAIHVKNGGLGVAFGKTSEVTGAVEINSQWSLYYKGFSVLPVIYKSTATERDQIVNPPRGLVCLIPKT